MTIRISNISETVKEKDFLDLLKKYGEISNFRMIPDRYTPKNLVIVYVDVSDEKMANKVIEEFSELTIEGERISAKAVVNA